MAGAPAHAVVGDAAKDGQYAFTAKIDIGDGKRSCTGALVESQWVLTAASCFADDPSQGFRITGGAPKQKATVTVGRTDLSTETGTSTEAVELVPRGDRDLVLVKLAKPVSGVAPVAVGTTAPRQGEELRVSGYGRTKDEWAAVRLHTGSFTVGSVSGSTIELTGKSAGAAVCKGDSGGPAFREKDGRFELVGINSTSLQGGCWGSDEAETGTAAVDARVDDVADWVQQTYSRTLLTRSNWKQAVYTASGYFTNGGAADGKRRMDLFVVWKDGEASLFQGADHDDPKQPFSAEYQIEKPGSYWTRARAVTGGKFAEDGSDGITVRWENGKVSTYMHVDQNGVHDEKTLRPGGGDNPFWKNARLITAGRYTENSLRDDLLVLWEDGSTSMYSDIGTKGLSGWTQLTKADNGWKNAAQISAGEFTGKKTADLLIRWNDGQAQLFPGVDTAGYHGSRVTIRPVGSAWKNSQVLTVGSFTAPTNRPNDILIGWNDGNLSYYPGVDSAGTHGEVQLVG
ncbi:trypsin-like serine protease [Streptomyces sp. ET3-23]|uniref:S1 family peptidase n=1 Tax=Streptomyces sp. ET3-23 TaxID=2885643 RepID=UPI001D120C38|nr:trypsin-like serine protease [Streptomyces sp. ET3-23]MCC2279117.1 trypsin-like serine protease [Streptomyces sp. ET3-23]